MNFLAGIVTYNPNLELLKKNIASVLPQVDYLVIVDNCSNNFDDIRQFQNDRIQIINNDSNRGIAYALNQEFHFALERGYKWVLTLDQDTIIPDNMLSEYQSFLNHSDVGLLTCRIQDRNITTQNNNQFKDKYSFVKVAITSGSLLNVDAWKKVNGFREELFIDSVDHDMCFSLLEHGYKIIRVNSVVLNHAIGDSTCVVSWGGKYQLYNESPLRNYYQFRNSIYLLKRHKRIVLDSYKYGLLGFVLSLVNRAFLICRYEKQSYTKFRMIVKGCVHGIIGKYGNYNQFKVKDGC